MLSPSRELSYSHHPNMITSLSGYELYGHTRSCQNIDTYDGEPGSYESSKGRDIETKSLSRVVCALEELPSAGEVMSVGRRKHVKLIPPQLILGRVIYQHTSLLGSPHACILRKHDASLHRQHNPS